LQALQLDQFFIARQIVILPLWARAGDAEVQWLYSARRTDVFMGSSKQTYKL